MAEVSRSVHINFTNSHAMKTPARNEHKSTMTPSSDMIQRRFGITLAQSYNIHLGTMSWNINNLLEHGHENYTESEVDVDEYDDELDDDEVEVNGRRSLKHVTDGVRIFVNDLLRRCNAAYAEYCTGISTPDETLDALDEMQEADVEDMPDHEEFTNPDVEIIDAIFQYGKTLRDRIYLEVSMKEMGVDLKAEGVLRFEITLLPQQDEDRREQRPVGQDTHTLPAFKKQQVNEDTIESRRSRRWSKQIVDSASGAKTAIVTKKRKAEEGGLLESLRRDEKRRTKLAHITINSRVEDWVMSPTSEYTKSR